MPMVHPLATFRRPLLVGGAAALLMATASLLVPNYYTSEARILPSATQDLSALGGLSAAAASFGVSLPAQESPDAAYVDILNSRPIREATLGTRYRFTERTWRFGTAREETRTLAEYLDAENPDRALMAFDKRVFISRDLKSKLIVIAVETASPELSQQVTRRLVELLNEFVVTKAQTRGSLKASYTEKRLAEARQGMAEAEDVFRSFLNTSRNYALSPDPAVRLKGLRLENELKLRTELVANLALGHEQALLEAKNDIPILNVLEPGNLPIEKSWPSRGAWSGLVFLLAAGATWVVGARHWLLGQITSARA